MTAEGQLNLFNQPLPVRLTDPETSHIAATQHRRKASENCNRILNVVLAHPGLTAAEISVRCGIEYHEVSRRLSDLEKKKHQAEPGEKRRDSITGNPMRTWFGVGRKPER
ncbi:MAG: helix-turn-helix domain-containing protein [Phycisphaerales bacterium]